MTDPMASINRSRPDQTEFEVSLTDQSACTTMAVRPRRDSQVGPMSQISVSPGQNPLPPQAL